MPSGSFPLGNGRLFNGDHHALHDRCQPELDWSGGAEHLRRSERFGRIGGEHELDLRIGWWQRRLNDRCGRCRVWKRWHGRLRWDECNGRQRGRDDGNRWRCGNWWKRRCWRDAACREPFGARAQQASVARWQLPATHTDQGPRRDDGAHRRFQRYLHGSNLDDAALRGERSRQPRRVLRCHHQQRCSRLRRSDRSDAQDQELGCARANESLRRHAVPDGRNLRHPGHRWRDANPLRGQSYGFRGDLRLLRPRDVARRWIREGWLSEGRCSAHTGFRSGQTKPAKRAFTRGRHSLHRLRGPLGRLQPVPGPDSRHQCQQPHADRTMGDQR